ncbi:MAG: oligosaccharide flippase family protein [Novosphingobium sp.]
MIAKLASFTRAGGGTAVIAMAARVSGQIAMVAVTLVATRRLSPADFGVFAVAGAFVMLARTMLYTGPFEFMLKAPVVRERTAAGACLAATLLVAGGWAVLLVGLGLAAPVLFRGSGVAPVILVLAPSVLLAAIAAFAESLMLRSGAVRTYYAITVGVEVGAGAAAIGLLLGGWGLWALVAQIYVRLALLILALGGLGPRLLPARPGRDEVADVLRWSASRFGSVVVGFLANYSGDLVLGVVFSPAAAGLYRASNRMVTALADMFVQPAGMLAMTTLAADRARGSKSAPGPGAWLRLGGLFAVLGWPALAVLALFADRLVPLALGPAWAAAGPVVAVFCLARMAGLVTAVASAALVVGDRQGRVLAVQTAAALATAGLTVLAAPLGALGAALAATAVAVLAAAALGYSALRRDEHAVLAEAARLVLIPLAGAFGAAIAADRLTSGAGGLLSLVLPLACGAVGWLIAAWPVAPALRRAAALLGERPQATPR